MLSQRHHQHCWALGSGRSILELSGVDIEPVSGVFSQKPPLQSPATKPCHINAVLPMKGKCSEIIRRGMGITGELWWSIKASHYRTHLWLEMTDRQVEEGQCQIYQTIPHQREETGCCLGIWSFLLCKPCRTFSAKDCIVSKAVLPVLCWHICRDPNGA